MNIRWLLIGALLFLVGLFSFCGAYRIYVLQNKEPQYIDRYVCVEVPEPCPPCPVYTPPPPPPFDVSVVERKWNTNGDYQAAYLVNIPPDGQWHDSTIQVSPGLTMIWNYDYGFKGGLQVRVVGSLDLGKRLPLDYEKSYFKHRFIRRREDGYIEDDEVILESTRNVEFKALENPLVIRVEIWKQ